MAIPATFLALADHRAPGLHFPAHPGAVTPDRTLPAPHHFGKPASPRAMEALKKTTSSCPAARDQLAEFYARYNGAEFCRLPDGDELVPLMTLLPAEDWEQATEELRSGDLSFLLDGLDDVLPRDGFVCIGGAPNEETRLLLSLNGTWEGRSSAGSICYASMDPVLGIAEPLAGSFFEFLNEFAAEPAKFFKKISSTYFLAKGNEIWGDVADRYLPEIGIAAEGMPAVSKDDPRQGLLY